ncbi:MAG: DUF2339 domain-containing protein, partial [Gammaproteobacteria bacterium]
MVWIGLLVGLILTMIVGEAFAGVLLVPLCMGFFYWLGKSLGSGGPAPAAPLRDLRDLREADELAMIRLEVRTLQEKVAQLESDLRKVMGVEAEVPEPVASPPPEVVHPAARAGTPPAQDETWLMPQEAPAPEPVAPPPEPVQEPVYEAMPLPEPERQPEPEPEPVAARAAPRENVLYKATIGWLLGGNTIVKVGVLILFLGLAFLLRYAAQNDMLPLELRYAAVAAAGVGLLAGGWRWRARADHYGLILQGAGTGVLYLVTLAAIKAHGLIPPLPGFVILVALAGLGAACAVLQDSLVLVMISALAGFATPVLLSSGGGNHVAFFSYLAILNVAIAGIAWFKAWRPLNLLGYGCTLVLGAAWGSRSYNDALFASTEPFLLGFFVLYVAITLMFARRTLAES